MVVMWNEILAIKTLHDVNHNKLKHTLENLKYIHLLEISR